MPQSLLCPRQHFNAAILSANLWLRDETKVMSYCYPHSPDTCFCAYFAAVVVPLLYSSHSALGMIGALFILQDGTSLCERGCRSAGPTCAHLRPRAHTTHDQQGHRGTQTHAGAPRPSEPVTTAPYLVEWSCLWWCLWRCLHLRPLPLRRCPSSGQGSLLEGYLGVLYVGPIRGPQATRGFL